MQNTKHVAHLALLLGLAWSASALAHDRLEQLTEQLGLYGDQVPQVEAILDDAWAMRQATRESGARGERNSVRETVRSRLELILTAEQMEKFDALKAERRSERNQRGRRDRHRGTPESE